MPTSEKITIPAKSLWLTGALVELLSGGPAMTVLDHCPDCDEVDVAYFADGTLDIVSLPAAALRPYEVN